MSQHFLQWKWKHSKKQRNEALSNFRWQPAQAFFSWAKTTFFSRTFENVHQQLPTLNSLKYRKTCRRAFSSEKIHWFSEYLLDLFFCGFYYFSPEAHISYHDPHAHTHMPTSETPFSLKTTYTVQCVLILSILLNF